MFCITCKILFKDMQSYHIFTKKEFYIIFFCFAILIMFLSSGIVNYYANKNMIYNSKKEFAAMVKRISEQKIVINNFETKIFSQNKDANLDKIIKSVKLSRPNPDQFDVVDDIDHIKLMNTRSPMFAKVL
jgi:hypothetical protein